jgi:hypothetical protein
MNAQHIVRVLHRRYPNMTAEQIMGWITVPELRVGSGVRRVDFFAMYAWDGNKSCNIAHEIKTSRSDFLKDIKNPQKQRLARLYSNMFYFVAPKGLLKPDEIPDYAGLLEVEEDILTTTIAAPWREAERPTWDLVKAIARSVSNKILEQVKP